MHIHASFIPQKIPLDVAVNDVYKYIRNLKQDSSKCREQLFALSGLNPVSHRATFTISLARHSSEAADNPVVKQAKT